MQGNSAQENDENFAIIDDVVEEQTASSEEDHLRARVLLARQEVIRRQEFRRSRTWSLAAGIACLLGSIRPAILIIDGIRQSSPTLITLGSVLTLGLLVLGPSLLIRARRLRWADKTSERQF